MSECGFISRLQLFMEHEGLNDNQFSIAAGLSNGLIGKAKNNGRGMTATNIEKILIAYPQLSPSWLLTGRGDMLKQTPGADGDPSRVSKDFDAGSIDRANPGATRPRIPFTAAAGALSIATNAAGDADCERLPVIATFPAYDFTIKIEGDSMAPDYLSGDELACRLVDNPANIKWGEPHILDTRDGVVFKVPYYGGEQIMCRSINPDGPSFLVDRADVLHVASIVGFTRQLQP